MLHTLSYFLPRTLLLLVTAVSLPACAQQTIVVNGNPPTPLNQTPYRTIQSGIDAASDGDTVAVVPLYNQGAYVENISFKGKAIKVTSGDPNGQVAIVQGFRGEPAFVFQNGETSKSVLSNFKILDGGIGEEPPYPALPGPYFGLFGSIYINAASPTITNNIITGGQRISILGAAATPAILNNTISQLKCNSIYVDGGAPLIQGNNISATTALINGSPFCGPLDGSAIRLLDGPTATTRIIGNTIENNVESGVYSGPGYIPTGPGGGAALSVNAPALIQNNIIRNNNSNFAWGGGIDIEGGTVSIVQNLIYGNHSDCGGGGIALPAESPNYEVTVLIANNTLVDNTSSPDYTEYCAPSAQIYSANVNVSEDLGSFRVIIVNNILSGDTNYIDVDCAQADPPNEAFQSIFDHNILYNAGGNFFGQYCVDVSARYGNLAADPILKSPSTSDYSLTSGSPAVDAGNTSAIQFIQQLSGLNFSTDVSGLTPRVLNATGKPYPIIDIGAYEYNPDGVTQAPPLPTTMVVSVTQPPDYHYVLTATTKSPNGIPVGPVSFFVDGVPLVSRTTHSSFAEINASGVATLTDFPLNAGTHALTATYPGHDGNPSFTPAIAIVNIVSIPLIPTHLLITDNVGGRAPFGSPVSFIVTSTADDGSFPTPVTLTDVKYQTLLTTLNFQDSDTISFATVAPSPADSHPIQAFYPGDLIYAPAADTDPFVSTGAYTTTTLTCGPTQVPVGTPVPLIATVTSTDPKNGSPSGSVYFKQNVTNIGSAVLANGIAPLVPSPLTVPGNNSFTATYPSQPGFSSSVSNACSVYSPALTITSSAPSPPGAPAYTPITFTAAIASSSIPAGNYSLTISTSPVTMVTMTPSATGTSATYQTSSLAPGTYVVTATFSPKNGSTPYTATLYPAQLVTAAIGDFTLTGPSTLTARTEKTASGTVTLNSIHNFSGTIALSCDLPLPTTYTCLLSPTSIPLAGDGVATSTITLAPTNLRAANSPPPGTARIVLAMLFPFTLLSFAGLRRRRATLRSLIALALLTMVMSTLTACGKDIFYTATQPGPYPLTITATGTTKGGAAPSTHTLHIILNLTP